MSDVRSEFIEAIVSNGVYTEGSLRAENYGKITFFKRTSKGYETYIVDNEFWQENKERAMRAIINSKICESVGFEKCDKLELISKLESKLKASQETIEELTTLIKSYCCCRSMGVTRGVCMFCEDLEKIK